MNNRFAVAENVAGEEANHFDTFPLQPKTIECISPYDESLFSGLL